MSTNLQEAAQSLQEALRKCDEIAGEIKRILSAEAAALDAGISKGEVTSAKAHLENAARNIARVKSELTSFGTGVAITEPVVQAKADGGGGEDDGVLPCGC